MPNGERTENLTEERIAVNQSIFRVANEQIELSAEKMALPGPVPFICECADAACTEIVRMSLAEYERVRSDPRVFFSATGHEAVDVNTGAGRVQARLPAYVLVQKTGIAGEIAEEGYDHHRHRSVAEP